MASPVNAGKRGGESRTATGAEISLFAELDSTSDYLKEHPELWAKNFYTVCAEEQTRGRGRNERVWLMQPGKDLAFTMVFHSGRGAREAIGITPYIGYVLYRILSLFVRKRLSLKWPNDILCDGKKVCGVLCEYVGVYDVFSGKQSTNRISAVLIGVGININSDASLNDPRAVSLRELSGHEFDLAALRREIINSLAQGLEAFQFPYAPQFCAEWYRACAHPHARVRWSTEDLAPCEGYITGIDAHGRLLAIDSEQKMHAISQEITYV